VSPSANSGPQGPHEIGILSSSLDAVNWNGDASPPLASPFFLFWGIGFGTTGYRLNQSVPIATRSGRILRGLPKDTGSTSTQIFWSRPPWLLLILFTE
jgi:hypothetical protein